MSRIITALQAQKRNRKRINVHLDGEFAFGLAATQATQLRVGQQLEDAEIQTLQSHDGRESAYQRALHLLSYRPRSEREIRRNLEAKGFDDIAIDHSLERLRETDLVDDVAFAHYWIEQRQLFRPRGAAMLRYELGQKGVERDIIAAALENIDEETLAYQAARRQAARLCHLPQKDFNRRLGSYLARRGFPYSIVREIADRLRDELEVDENE